MTSDTVTLFFAMLAIASELAVLVVVVVFVAARFSPAAAEVREDLVDAVGGQALWLALLVAAVATFGSLYLSEVAHFVPCRLCWYQRIAMYPLVPILGLAAWQRDRHIRPYVAILAGIGLLISCYHVLVERFPSLESKVCEASNPCTIRWVEHFGYVTIPVMAGSAFALILTLIALARDPHYDEHAVDAPVDDTTDDVERV